MKFNALLLTFATLNLVACAHIPGGITDSTEPINNRQYEEIGKTEATSSRIALFGIIPLSNSNSIQNAIDLAKEQIGADALVKVTAEGYSQWFLLFSHDAIVVRGVGIKFK
jgi:hypothetical protein